MIVTYHVICLRAAGMDRGAGGRDPARDRVRASGITLYYIILYKTIYYVLLYYNMILYDII